MNAKAKKMAELLKLLANEHRLLIFCALMDHEMTVNNIAKYTPSISLSALSQHLRILKDNGILECSKSGQHVTYSIADTKAKEIIHTLRRHYCFDNESADTSPAL